MRPTVFLFDKKVQPKGQVSEQLLAGTWLAVKNVSRKDLMEKFDLQVSLNLNWDAGLLLKNDASRGVGGNFLMPPSLDGWTFLVGKTFNDNLEMIRRCKELSMEFGEVYFFSNIPSTDNNIWIYGNDGLMEKWETEDEDLEREAKDLPFDFKKFNHQLKFKDVLLCKNKKSQNQMRLW